MGPAKDDPRLAALIFDRVPGDLSSGKNDLWVVLGVHGEPLLLRSLWKGVTPKGRLLCAPVNTAAIQWLQNNSRLSRATALCSGSFSSELVQVETLRQCTETLLALLGEASPNLSLPFETPELPLPLNDQQSEVVRHVAAWAGGEGEEWGGRVLVQGVFGSGKSCTLAACIMVLDRLLEAQKDTRRILLLCQTNVAVDRVLRCLLSLGWDNFVRLGNFRAMHPAVLHRAAGLRPARATQDFIDALMQHEQVGDLAIRDKLAVLRTAASNGELPIRPSEWKRRRLVATTAAALESADHLGLAAPFCFVDEASQLTEPSLVHAFIRAQAKFALLLGDTKQLPPRAVHPPLQRSALARLSAESSTTLELRTQYRCHPYLANLCSELFYDGRLLSGVTAEERSSALGPGVAPLAVVLSEGSETRVGQSYRHDAEAQLCAAWLGRASLCGRLAVEDFGVICLYKSHAEACSDAAKAGGLRGIDFATVDAFQGGEREAIVLCCGRSTPVGGDVAFASCPQRLNVALSRARRHLVIFGTKSFLSTHPIFSRVLSIAAASGRVHGAAEVMG